MNKKYKYIHFECYGESVKTSHWFCKNNKSNGILGIVKWYGPWRQYCFFPSGDTVFNIGCMTDIGDFINQLMSERNK